jgi:hypothetical protein
MAESIDLGLDPVFEPRSLRNKIIDATPDCKYLKYSQAHHPSKFWTEKKVNFAISQAFRKPGKVGIECSRASMNYFLGLGSLHIIVLLPVMSSMYNHNRFRITRPYCTFKYSLIIIWKTKIFLIASFSTTYLRFLVDDEEGSTLPKTACLLGTSLEMLLSHKPGIKRPQVRIRQCRFLNYLLFRVLNHRVFRLSLHLGPLCLLGKKYFV